MRLWTWQSPQWNICDTPRDLERARTAWNDIKRLEQLYDKLHRKLGTCQFIYCEPRYSHWTGDEIRTLWVLDVPDDEILAYLDAEMWRELLDGKFKTATETTAWDRLLLDRKTAGERILRIDDSCHALILQNPCPQCLVRVPVPKQCVIDCSRFNKGGYDQVVRYEDLPRSLEEARRCRQRPPGRPT